MLFVHPNTVRYRLRRVGRDHRLRTRPTRARATSLRIALRGRLARCGPARARAAEVTCRKPPRPAAQLRRRRREPRRGPRHGRGWTGARHRLPRPGRPDPRLPAPWLELPGFADRLALAVRRRRHRPGRATAPTPTPTRSGTPRSPSRCSWPAAWSSLLEPVPRTRPTAFQVGRRRRRPQRRRDHRRRGRRRASPPSRRWCFVRERGRGHGRPPRRSTPTGMTAVLGGDQDEVLAAHRPARPDPGEHQRRRPGRRRRHAGAARRARRRPAGQGPGASRCRWPAPSTPSTWPRRCRCWPGYARAIYTHDPRTRLLSNADGAVVHDGREVLAPAGHPGQQPGPLGPVHGDHARPRGHRR